MMRFKHVLVVVVVIVLCLTMLTSTVLAADTTKNETVYAALNSDGSVSRIYVVNQLTGDYTDYGTYTDIKNLSTTSEPSLSGDRITFPDKNVDGGLYYQGTMTGELPMMFSIGYQLDGKAVIAEELSGAKGHLVITVKAAQNTLCEEAVRDGLMAQITAKLDTQYVADIITPDSTAVAVGRTVTMSYIVLPGEEGTMVIEADVHDFRMDQIAITMLKGTMAASGIEEKLDEYDDGFDEMLDGADDMVDGTTELKDGMESLADGLGDLSGGMGKLSSGGSDLYGGMKEYGKNLSAYLSGVENIVQHSADIRKGLNTLEENGTTVAQGISDISGGMSGLSSSSGDLKALAESLAASTDPQVAALAAGTLKTLAVIDELSGGLDSASDGLDAYVAGVEETTEGYAQFHKGIKKLADGGGKLSGAYKDILSGMNDYTDGVSRSASGAKRIYKSVKGLPDDIQELIDGQLEFKDGIATAKDEMNDTKSMFIADDEPPVSFASPGKNHPESVQYILTTPAIAKKDTRIQTATTQEDVTVQESFLTRFTALFN